MVLRSILLAQGYSKNSMKVHLKAALAGDAAAPSPPSGTTTRRQFSQRSWSRFCKEVQRATAADTIDKIDDSDIHELADVFESWTASLLLKSGVSFQNEKQQREQRLAEEGAGSARQLRQATPDFLMVSGDDSSSWRWLECKHSYGTAHRDACHAFKRLQTQAHRYIAAFGPGIMLFRHGFSSELRDLMPSDCLLLNADVHPSIERMQEKAATA